MPLTISCTTYSVLNPMEWAVDLSWNYGFPISVIGVLFGVGVGGFCFFFDTSGELIPISTEVLIYLHTLCDSKCSTVYEFNLLSISEGASLVYRVY